MWELFRLVVSLTAVSFGGGQILLAGLERSLVQTGRLSPHDFAAAVALGQSTPGPLAAFTTAVGLAVDGLGGAVAATAGLLLVSLAAVLLIVRIPLPWFRLQAVKAGLAAVAPLVSALAVFLALRSLVGGGNPGLVGLAVIVGVVAGRLLKVSTVALTLGALAAGALLT